MKCMLEVQLKTVTSVDEDSVATNALELGRYSTLVVNEAVNRR